jgi:glycine reductase
MDDKIRVVHYVNQFFGGVGGEEHANLPVQTQEGAVGPGRALAQAFGDRATIVATIVAGDNYFVEEEQASAQAAADALKAHEADVVVAGPAFDAGRYGLACAQMCKIAQEQGIPAVTAMTADNTGIITYGSDVVAVATGSSPAEMRSIMDSLAQIALKLGRGEELGSAEDDGYLPREVRKPTVRAQNGAARAVDMMEARLLDQPFNSEVYVKQYDDVDPPGAISGLSEKKIALVTSGGMVPRGNPDRLVSARAEGFFRYDISGLDELTVGEWESVHGGFNTQWLNTKDPGYALPLRTVRQLESEGTIGSVYDVYFATTGNQTAVTSAQRMGREIAQELQDKHVDAVLLVAT